MLPPDILRMRWLNESAIYRLPEESNVRPKGKFNWALVGAPPSPEKPAVLLPAYVLITYCWPHTQFKERTPNARGARKSRIVIIANLETNPRKTSKFCGYLRMPYWSGCWHACAFVTLGAQRTGRAGPQKWGSGTL